MPLAVIHSRDDDGRAVVGVPISNRPGTYARLYAADYEASGTTPLSASAGSDGPRPDDPENQDGSVILRTVESEDGQSFSLYLSDERDLTVLLNVERDAADLTAPR